MLTATYSPEDDKLRLYSSTRLDSETYERVKAHGFRWAPAQELFFAVWSPERADLLESLAGEIEDEDKSLAERAEERAERFEDYSENRRADSERAHAAVSAIADGIPLGQPILVGHHSERHARKDAERIENGMRRAVKMWETSQYWKDRAEGAIRHAKYKELPGVRARRIKGLESDLRKQERIIADSRKFRDLWSADGLTRERAKAIANHDHISACFPLAKYPRDLPASQYEGSMSIWSALDGNVIDEHAAARISIDCHERSIRRAERWADHFRNRLEYERAMLGESGGIVTDRKAPEKGGACRCWVGFNGEWCRILKVNKVSVTVGDNWGNGGKDFTRTVPFDKLRAVMSAAEVAEADSSGRSVTCRNCSSHFILSDSAPEAKPQRRSEEDRAPEWVDAAKDVAKNGVQVVTAPDLFPTPPEVASMLCDAAEDGFRILAGARILEPSAGTGNIVRAIHARTTGPDCCRVDCIDVSPACCDALKARRERTVYANESNWGIELADFLEVEPRPIYDFVLMNPPFSGGADMRHVGHALKFLKPGASRLVAIMAGGPRQRAWLESLGRPYSLVELPDGSFASSGTDVRTVLVTVDG